MAAETDLTAVVTQPDRPRGRGRATEPPPVKSAAEPLSIPVLQPERVRDPGFIETVRALSPDVLVLASFGQIIPRALLELPPLGPINIHASLLPDLRGAAPVHYALLRGRRETGVTTMWMAQKLDAGDILLRASEPIRDDDTTLTLTDRLAHRGANLLMETLTLLADGRCPRVAQDHAAATYAPVITPATAVIDWSQDARTVWGLVRAMAPRPGASAQMRDRSLKVLQAEPIAGAYGDSGSVVALSREGVEVATGCGAVRLLTVQPTGGRQMMASDWARGARVAVGDRFDDTAASVEQ